VIDAVRRARLSALIAADLDAIERRDVLPPWCGLPEDARVLEAWRELVAVDVSDRTRHIDEVHADLVRARARCDLALAVRDAEMREALNAPRPTLRRLQAELARLSAADLVALGEEAGPLAFAARCLTHRDA
jgi:hypothetical protein